uniref:(northern house mosquito) hypothetical protein n=1 Tax=Culex pipiens TaxID=7175 RepID=A0A8D8EWD6_CULPI
MFGLEKKPFAVELHSDVVEFTCVVDLEAHLEVTSLQRSSLEQSPSRKSLIIVTVAWKAIFAFVDSGSGLRLRFHRNRLSLNPDLTAFVSPATLAGTRTLVDFSGGFRISCRPHT